MPLMRSIFQKLFPYTFLILNYNVLYALSFYLLVKKVEFSEIHCFNYSPRSGTVAYKLKDLSGDIKKERLKKLISLADEY